MYHDPNRAIFAQNKKRSHKFQKFVTSSAFHTISTPIQGQNWTVLHRQASPTGHRVIKTDAKPCTLRVPHLPFAIQLVPSLDLDQRQYWEARNEIIDPLAIFAPLRSRTGPLSHFRALYFHSPSVVHGLTRYQSLANFLRRRVIPSRAEIKR